MCSLRRFPLSYRCMVGMDVHSAHSLAFPKSVRAVTVVTGWANNVSSQTLRAVKINETYKKVLLYFETIFFFSLQFLPISLNSEVSENWASLCVTVFQVSEASQSPNTHVIEAHYLLFLQWLFPNPSLSSFFTRGLELVTQSAVYGPTASVSPGSLQKCSISGLILDLLN